MAPTPSDPLQRMLQAGVVVVSRLRKDAALWSVPEPVPPGQRKRGKPRKYGTEAISLAKRAGHRHGWQQGDFVLYGKQVHKKYKTFLATYKPAGGLIRVLLVKDPDHWVAYFCTQADATVQEILEAVADRSAIEQNFHDLKEVHGAGQQQLRNYWANIAAYHVTLWWHTLIELWAWYKPHEELTDRMRQPLGQHDAPPFARRSPQRHAPALSGISASRLRRHDPSKNPPPMRHLVKLLA